MNPNQPLPESNLVLRMVTTVFEREAAFRLRYQLFTRELSDERYADHEREFYYDSWDHDESPVVLAWSSLDEAVGTLRLANRRLGPYLADDLYQWGTLANRVNLSKETLLNSVGIISRGGVLKPFRRTRIMSSMLEYLETISEKEGITILVGAVEASNRKSQSWIESNGFHTYCESRTDARFHGDFYFKDLRTGLT